MSIDTEGGPGQGRTLWIGSYTGDMGQGAGVSRLDLATGRREVVAEESEGVVSPSWLVEAGHGVVAVSERDPGALTFMTEGGVVSQAPTCLLYTSDAADE